VSHRSFEETAKLVFSLPSFRIPALDLRSVLEDLGKERTNMMQVLIIDLQKSYQASRIQTPEGREFASMLGDEIALDTLVSQLRRLQDCEQLKRIESVNSGITKRDDWCYNAKAKGLVEYVRIAPEECQCA